MAEIRSTLDLVMERTRHLSLSADEKKAQSIQSIKQQCRGLVQRYGDKAINAEQFRREATALEQRQSHYRPALLIEAVIEMLDLEGDSTRIGMLAQYLGIDMGPLQQVGEEYRRVVKSAAALRRDQAQNELHERFDISGSAVVACLDGDQEWIRTLKGLQIDYGQRLDREKQQLLRATDQM